MRPIGAMKGSEKRKYALVDPESEEILDEDELDISIKLAAAKATPSVVTVVSRHVPEEMTEYQIVPGVSSCCKAHDDEDVVFWGSGTIVECEEDTVSHKYFSTIITVANLFIRTNGVQPHQIKTDVYLSDGKLCDGQVLACDFHYNLASIRVQTDFPFQPATLKCLEDVVSINPAHHLRAFPEKSFQLLPHSNLFKILPHTKIVSLSRTCFPYNGLCVSSKVLGYDRTTSSDAGLDCYELYWLKDTEKVGPRGGPLINCSGEVIGIMFYDSCFLPINVVSRWWNHYKSCRQYRRPWLGVEVANLHSSRLDLLEEFMRKFPSISTGAVVTKVAKDSPAYCSGIRPKDVIVECDGKLVRSKLEFFDIIWDKVEESVEVNALRASNGEKLKLRLIVGETTPDKFYKWQPYAWDVFQRDWQGHYRFSPQGHSD